MILPISVNQAIDDLVVLDGQEVIVQGILHFDFEEVALYHFPTAQRRAAYDSSIWISTGTGSLGFNEEACKRLHGKRVTIEGRLLKPAPDLGGCGHMSLWPAELLARTLEPA
ncbi:hypothetical protein ACFQUU_22930 [Herbaspirillum sp. GCM10030257]|uniref:hypothetical protein n=1 Tax=Herbaspirillum sp. GCM10030257 TaxID=3273393 RepID=UPI003619C996